ncbi:DUF3180 domain-containing protein [Corynebacterium sp. sy017]|uniref:DUF3180 domain-containing protein n=1 Tax=unclassified Corynebacterium TaxID=2624378 RepID=UPI00118534E5|nr:MULTISPECIES: DUF3180 domain-containing protein [unclassified Corynebacterium]MBP3088568.1 DUF3180 domain-containing protein [Corynebacterium sp. sy017]TSD91865.1 DUF3180 domain-containing protein [Corynebacterium sp. SY003]
MKRTPIANLIATAVFCALASFIVVMRFYGVMSNIPVSVALMLWTMATLCALLALKVRKKIQQQEIGLDRSQLNPLNVAQCMVVGKASAWTGAIFSGFYAGISAYVLLRYPQLAAAQEDMPRAIITMCGALAMAAAGVFLEKSCSVPPPHDAEPA